VPVPTLSAWLQISVSGEIVNTGVDSCATQVYSVGMETLTPNQIVAHNLKRARSLHGISQVAAADRLQPFLGAQWSRAVFSAAERSVTGQRIRQFSADEITAFAAAFEVPIAFFFVPPPDVDRVGVAGAPEQMTREQIMELATGSIEERVSVLSQRFVAKLESMGFAINPTPDQINRASSTPRKDQQ
jgi:hypothetical protein